MRETAAIPAPTSLLISEPRFDMALLCANHLSFHPRVLFVMESLYFVETDCSLDLIVSENDCASADGPASSWLTGEDWLLEALSSAPTAPSAEAVLSASVPSAEATAGNGGGETTEEAACSCRGGCGDGEPEPPGVASPADGKNRTCVCAWPWP